MIQSIKENRDQLHNDFQTNPSLQGYCQKIFNETYRTQRQNLKNKAKSFNKIPKTAYFSTKQALQQDYLNI